MESIKDLLLNLLVIILPVLLYQSFFPDKLDILNTLRNRLTIGGLSLISILLCMTFPFFIMPGYIYDLRIVPLLVGTLYGGYWVGIIISAVLIICHIYLGYLAGTPFGVDLLCVLLAYPVILSVTLAVASRYNSYPRKQKTIWAMLLALFASALVSLVVISSMDDPILDNPHLPFFLMFTLIHALGMWMAVHLAENMQEKSVMRHEIQQAEKLHLLGELAASIAHEIRNPMTVVRGFLQLLQEDQIPAEKKMQFLKLGIEELDRSESIISNYLSFARPQLKKMEKTSIAERIDHASGIISSYATLRNVEIKQESEADLPVFADPEKISQVLMNLIKNGIEAMAQGGVLQIRAYRHKKDVIIEVSDTGCGMTKEQTARLGNPFFSTKEKGTGLGLTVSYQIIHSINGKVHVNSQKDKGTQFVITLPMALS